MSLFKKEQSILPGIHRAFKLQVAAKNPAFTGVIGFSPFGDEEGASKFSIDSPLYQGEEINTRTADFISLAQERVRIQFFNFQEDCDAASDIYRALKALSDKGVAEGKKIHVQFIVNYRVGLAATFTASYSEPLAQVRAFMAGLPGIEFGYRLHKHSSFDAYHTKQIIVDDKMVMLRSGDIADATNYRAARMTGGLAADHLIDTKKEMASIFYGDIARYAAEDFRRAWCGCAKKPLRSRAKDTKGYICS